MWNVARLVQGQFAHMWGNFVDFRMAIAQFLPLPDRPHGWRLVRELVHERGPVQSTVLARMTVLRGMGCSGDACMDLCAAHEARRAVSSRCRLRSGGSAACVSNDRTRVPTLAGG